MEHVVYEMNKIACELACDAAREITAKEPHRPRLVAGAIGPTNRTLSISPSVEDPGFRNCTWDEVVAAYKTQVSSPGNSPPVALSASPLPPPPGTHHPTNHNQSPSGAPHPCRTRL